MLHQTKEKFYILEYGMVREALYTVSWNGWTDFKDAIPTHLFSAQKIYAKCIVKSETKSPTLIKRFI